MVQPLAKSNQILNEINIFLESKLPASEFEVAKLKRQAHSCAKPESFALLAAISSLIKDKNELIFNAEAALRYHDHWATWVSYLALFNGGCRSELCELVEKNIYHLDNPKILDAVNVSAIYTLNHELFLTTKEFSAKNNHQIMYKDEAVFHFLNNSDYKTELTSYIKYALNSLPYVRKVLFYVMFEQDQYESNDYGYLKVGVGGIATEEVSDVEFEWLRRISESNITPEIKSLISFGMECIND